MKSCLAPDLGCRGRRRGGRRPRSIRALCGGRPDPYSCSTPGKKLTDGLAEEPKGRPQQYNVLYQELPGDNGERRESSQARFPTGRGNQEGQCIRGYTQTAPARSAWRFRLRGGCGDYWKSLPREQVEWLTAYSLFRVSPSTITNGRKLSSVFPPIPAIRDRSSTCP